MLAEAVANWDKTNKAERKADTKADLKMIDIFLTKLDYLWNVVLAMAGFLEKN